MLVLTRKQNEVINIGQDIEIVIFDIKDDHVKIGIKAPKDVTIFRQEVYKAILKENELASQISKEAAQAISDVISQKIAKKPL
ncbi:MAG: carbon storage regulator CsrA [Rubrobacteridae bacterium]|nr:carbon storage regulator CsrA [Rubrobacteridae bacterium]